MKLLYSGAEICDLATLKRLLLMAEEIGFTDRPSVTFADWGTIADQTPARRINTSGSPVAITAHAPPSGPVSPVIERYIESDLSNPDFARGFLAGLRQSDVFAGKFIQPEATYSSGSGTAFRAALIADEDLAAASYEDPVIAKHMAAFETHEQRREALKILLIEASIKVTTALVVSEETSLVPVTEDPVFAQLLAMRTSDAAYLGGTSRSASHLGFEVARALIPDGVLAQLEIPQIIEYRVDAADAYLAWNTEINRLASMIDQLDPDALTDEIPRIIATDVAPRLVDYRNEMKDHRDRLFGDLIKTVAKWELPSLSLSYLASLDPATALALFVAALQPAVPHLVDYFEARRGTARDNAMSYLIGLTGANPDDR